MIDYHKVKDHEELQRDPHSKAILVTDRTAYLKHLEKKKMVEQTNNINERVSNLEDKMDQILSLLQQSINTK
jgi:hypothetical protein